MSVRLKDHIEESLKSLKTILLFASSFTAFVLTFLIVLHSSIDADRSGLMSARGYLLSLITSSDGPDLLRYVNSYGAERKSLVTVIHDGVVIATNHDLSDIGFKAASMTSGVSFLGYRLLGGTFMHEVPLSEKPLVQIRVQSNARPILWTSLIVAVLSTLIVFILLWLVNRAIGRAVDQGLSGLDEVVASVKRLGQGMLVPSPKSPFRVSELQDIQSSIEAASIALEEAQNILTESKAKEMTARAYQSLIHDLHTPVACLSSWSTLLQDESLLRDDQVEAINGVARTAKQILLQVTSGRKNLELLEGAPALSDIKATLRNCIDQVREAKRGTGVGITVEFSDDPMLVLHDPVNLTRAVVNLLENAVDAAGSKVSVRLIHSNTTVAISIEDDGPGMAIELVSQFLSGRGISEKKGRQAFGLSGAAHIARAHNGRIIYRPSKTLGGSNFQIQLGVQ